MKILVIHNQYQQAGGERGAVLAQLSLLREHQHEVIYYTRHNEEIERFNLYQKFGFVFQTLYSIRTTKEIESIIRLERPDIAHIHNVFPLISPSIYHALHRAKIPIVQTIHNFRFMCPNGLFYTNNSVCERCIHGNTIHALYWKCYRNSYLLSAEYALAIGLHRQLGTFNLIDRFLALTEFSAIKLIQSGLTSRDHIQVLGNFLPEPLPQIGEWTRQRKYIVFIGRLSLEKGLHNLIFAMQELPEIPLKIIGVGELAEPLQSEVKQKGINNVEFLGYVEGQTKWDLLRDAQISVIPSEWYEHFPLAALESLAVGTPVIATNHGSLPYIIEDNKSGLLFTPGDKKDLKQKILSLFNNTAAVNMMGKHGRKVIEDRYTASHHYHILNNIYSELTGRSN